MFPLQRFQHITQQLSKKPLEFWRDSEQKKMIEQSMSAAKEIKRLLESNSLTHNYAYQSVSGIETSVTSTHIEEVSFFQHLHNLIGVYKASSFYTQYKNFLDPLDTHVEKAKQKIVEYHVALEEIETKKKEFSLEQQKKKDTETLTKIGIFYVMEYTIYVLSLLPSLSQDDKRKIFFEGLQTTEANLPSYVSFVHSFRRDFCFKILDNNVRRKLLEIFFAFEETLETKDISNISSAFKMFNIHLLHILRQNGIRQFQTVFLSPYGKDITIEMLIEKIQKITV